MVIIYGLKSKTKLMTLNSINGYASWISLVCLFLVFGNFDAEDGGMVFAEVGPESRDVYDLPVLIEENRPNRP